MEEEKHGGVGRSLLKFSLIQRIYQLYDMVT